MSQHPTKGISFLNPPDDLVRKRDPLCGTETGCTTFGNSCNGRTVAFDEEGAEQQSASTLLQGIGFLNPPDDLVRKRDPLCNVETGCTSFGNSCSGLCGPSDEEGAEQPASTLLQGIGFLNSPDSVRKRGPECGTETSCTTFGKQSDDKEKALDDDRSPAFSITPKIP